MAVGFQFGGNANSVAQSDTMLVQFRAGKSTLGTDNIVSPDTRRGLVQIERGRDDQLMHFIWRPRNANSMTSTLEPEDDLIIFPDDIDFKRVKSCKSNRTFVLKFKSSNRKLFFWMQEPNAEKDDEYCRKVNDVLNNPEGAVPMASESGGGSTVAGTSSNKRPSLARLSNAVNAQSLIESMGYSSNMQSLLASLSQDQLAQLFGDSLMGVGGSEEAGNGTSLTTMDDSDEPYSQVGSLASLASLLSNANEDVTGESGSDSNTTESRRRRSAASTAEQQSQVNKKQASSSGGAKIQLADLQNIISGLRQPGGEAGSSTSNTSKVNLADGINRELLAPLLKDANFVDKMKTFLPEEVEPRTSGSASEATRQEIEDTVVCPQFRQAMTIFSSAFQTCQLGPLMKEFGLSNAAVDAASTGDMTAFIAALKASGESTGQSSNNEQDKTADTPTDDDRME